MAIYTVNAYEGFYGGLHGINDTFLMKSDSLSEVEAEAREASLDVIESFNIAADVGWVEQAIDQGLVEDTEEYWDYINEYQEDDIAFEIKKVKDTSKTYEELEEELDLMGYEEFVKEYC